MDINLAITLANIAKRALTLFDEGYRMIEDETFDGFFTVTKPTGESYLVICDGIKESCSCEAYKQYRCCKHLLAVKAEVDRTAAMCAEYDRMMAETETLAGCDYSDGPMVAGAAAGNNKQGLEKRQPL